MIPKIIHFVWLGNNEKPDYVLRCMESWKKYCPDYTIMEWGNDSLKDISCPYVHQSVANKKWAFASDVIRLKALYEYGGIYVDTDVEITNNIDKFLEYEFVSGYEDFHSSISPITAFMGAEKGNAIIKDLLSEYDGLAFEENGKLNLTTNTERIKIYFKNKYGLHEPYDGNATTYLEAKVVLFPATHFCVMGGGGGGGKRTTQSITLKGHGSTHIIAMRCLHLENIES